MPTEHEKCMVSVCLAAKADGIKLKSSVVKSSGNAWMNVELTAIWVKQVLGGFSFNS